MKIALKKIEKSSTNIQYLNNFVGKCLHMQQQFKTHINKKNTIVNHKTLCLSKLSMQKSLLHKVG